jgi:xanthine dehydrogenase YagS FAD-binding subunit
MNTFTFARAASVEEAVKLGSGPSTSFLAGGTTIVDLMKLNVMTPATLVDLGKLPLDTIDVAADGSIKVGALVKNSDLARHEAVVKNFPGLSAALLSGASESLRNMATLGGNMLQRTRCTYFRDGISACNKRTPGSGCAAATGFSRSCAVLGVSESCIATNPSDMNVALIALDATVQLQGSKGAREVKFAEFHLEPGKTPEKETVLEPGEVITSITIPASKLAANSTYVKVRDRASYEFALASCAAALDIEAGVVKSARLALGGVATKPWRAEAAEKVLLNAKPSEDLFRIAADTALAGAKTTSDNAFKVELCKRAIVRALMNVSK